MAPIYTYDHIGTHVKQSFFFFVFFILYPALWNSASPILLRMTEKDDAMHGNAHLGELVMYMGLQPLDVNKNVPIHWQ